MEVPDSGSEVVNHHQLSFFFFPVMKRHFNQQMNFLRDYEV